MHSAPALALACRGAIRAATQLGTRPPVSAAPASPAAWRSLVSRELRAALCSNTAFCGAAPHARTAAAASGEFTASRIGLRAARDSLRPAAAQAVAFSSRAAAAQQTPVWVSDPAALKAAAGVGARNGASGAPYFGYGRHVLAPIAFSLAVTGGAFLWALLADDDREAVRAYDLWVRGESDTTDLAALVRAANRGMQPGQLPPPPRSLTAHEWADQLPLLLRPAGHAWASMPDPARTVSVLVAANLAVAAAWRLPPLRPLMARNFAHTPGAGRCRTLLLSAFSHRGALHLACNMLALWSFGQAAMRELGREQFLAFYASSAVLASLASHLATVLPLVGGNIPAAALLARVQAIRPSLGASGAVIALFGLVAARQPERQVNIVFLPEYPFSIGAGFKGMVAFDLAGVLLRWQIFDHQAHLGGAAVGAVYAKWGEALLWDNPAVRHAALAAREKWRHLGDEGGQRR